MSSTKTVIALKAAGSKGKTDSLHELASILLNSSVWSQTINSTYNSAKNTNGYGGDFRLVIKTVNGKIVVIETQGDPNTALSERLSEVENKYSPDLLFCATRTGGNTKWDVERHASTIGYDLMWASPYGADKGQPKTGVLNHLTAKHLFDVAQSLSLL